MTIGTLGMFESQQVIEGEIFIHYRRQEMLSIFNRHELPAVYFECFIETQNFYGHFVDVHAVSSDWVRAIYIQKKGQNKIIALFNHTQNVVHLHPNHMIFSRWSIIHKGIPNMIYVFGLSVVLLLLFFSFERTDRCPSICRIWFNVIFIRFYSACCHTFLFIQACTNTHTVTAT